MTVQLDLPPEVVARLSEEASREGLSLEAYLLQTVLRKTSNGTTGEDEGAKRSAREAAARTIRELRKDNVLGPDLSIRTLIEEGRRF